MKNKTARTIMKATRSLVHMGLMVLLAWTFSARAEEGTTLTTDERREAIAQLEESRKKFLAAIAGLSEQQWNFKPAPDRWSIAECAEHITVTEAGLFRLVTEQLMKSTAEPEKIASRKPDNLIRQMLSDRSHKVQAPEMLRPTGRWKAREQVEQTFNQLRSRTIAYVRDTKDDLRHHFAPNPFFGPLDGYQWLIYLPAHCERHTAQIAEVKADPKFPPN